MKSDLLKWADILRVVLKIIPMIMSAFCIINCTLAYLGFNTIWINYISGVSLLPILFLYLASYAFKFCAYHRMFLHYVVISNIVVWIDTYIGIPLSDLNLLILYYVIAGIFLFIILKMKINTLKSKK